MSDIFTNCYDSTPLTEEERKGLKTKWVTTRAELNELETQGIVNAEFWLMSNTKRSILSKSFIQALHKKMFGNVWIWAGRFRTTEKNIGVNHYMIRESLEILFGDIDYWILNKTFSEKEIAIRFHHRLVQIHPFPNGNGRTSRIMADILIHRFGLGKLSWGKH